MLAVITGIVAAVLAVPLAVRAAAAFVRAPRPTCVSDLGVRIYSSGYVSIQPADVDAALLACIRAFDAAGLWDADSMFGCYRQMRLSLVPDDTYCNYGRTVTGHTDGDWVVVAAGGRKLSDTAFAHEMAHFFGMHIDGYTDHTHHSWHSAVYPAVNRAKALMRDAGV